MRPTIRHSLTTVVLSVALFGSAPVWAAVVGDEDIEPSAMAEMPCREQPFSVLVTVSNVKDAKGLITADLHDDDPARWLKGGQHLARVRVPAVRGETSLCVPVPKAGTYAIAVYHDRNGNRLFDKGMFGIPAEPYGVSNNPPMAFGPPKLEESSFRVEGKLVPVAIKLRP